jgi:hypothetical protein
MRLRATAMLLHLCTVWMAGEMDSSAGAGGLMLPREDDADEAQAPTSP